MKRNVMGAIIVTLLLSACGQSTPVPVIENATSTPSPLPTNTSSLTHRPTASITPLPTIPTFTPTFDAKAVAHKAECPKENSATNLNLEFILIPSDIDASILDGYPKVEKILGFLNDGGRVSLLINEINNIEYRYEDLTGDAINELIWIDNSIYPSFYIFYCDTADYKVFSGRLGVLSATINEVEDTNKNGLPDITILYYRLALFGDSPYGDVNINPWRIYTITYEWNGQSFFETLLEYSAPEYRFQAIQDADQEVSNGRFGRAISLYQDAINKNLDWWSPEKKKYIDSNDPLNSSKGANQLTSPVEDTTEYPRLAAYAYYRIMLLHFAQGNESEAITTYNTLLETFGNNSYAHPYIEMATAFWEAYQSTHKMYDGCAAAIQYAAKHPEILIPLGSDYHGWQSHTYVPEDVCPFR